LNSFRQGTFAGGNKNMRSSNISDNSGILTPQYNKIGNDPKANLNYIRQMLKSHNGSGSGNGSDFDNKEGPSQEI
jgi:hypothetical protein